MKNNIAKRPELLAPAGSPETLRAAVQAGADAVYMGAGKFSARAYAKNFDGEALAQAICYARENGVAVHLAVNTLMTDRELDEALQLVGHAHHLGVAAFIVQDIGLAARIRREFPSAVLHASTQMTARSPDDVQMLQKLGFCRVVMARELTREALKKIAANTAMELEVFVHGALCSSYSGQCLISSFIGGRSANRGKCAQPCRLTYKQNGKQGVLLSLKDLCLIDYVGELTQMGVASLKIEGRMKGEDYVRTVVKAYRNALDGNPLTAKQREKLLGVFNRGGYTDGYFTGSKKDMYMQNLKNPYDTQNKKRERSHGR
ncbi:MAG: U32 family peptidase [Defluviitaleaceae bacterium]|nr:U32 family peptidase [Defluviitaleaceae bacterium]MCL2276218.1 U32 family peptidase [Defluviitaleaceae bacterium]